MITSMPEHIRQLLQRCRQQFVEAGADNKQLLESLDQSLNNQLDVCWGGSDYASDLCMRLPEILKTLIQDGQLTQILPKKVIQQSLSEILLTITSEDELASALRQFRHYHQLRIIWRDLNRLADLTETMNDLSNLADCCIDGACQWLYERLCASLGTPYGLPTPESELVPQKMVVLGMGKLGACELNLSSDIDLIFCYPCIGEVQGGSCPLSNQEFFIRLSQKLIAALDAKTEDGFVFRVDMRLRPYGKSGVLVLSFAAMEQYYQDHGRDWERYAMIKARAVAGDIGQGNELLQTLKPFVYRRYLDFGAVEALREMKRLIHCEVFRRNMLNNIKLGPGGIREIEFIVQSFQLIHGGRERQLQQRSLLRILTVLTELNYLPETVCDELSKAYYLLRNTEHALQAVADRQTQTLPVAEQDNERLAWVMGYDTCQAFHKTLDYHQKRVIYHFEKVVRDPNANQQSSIQPDSDWKALWSALCSPEEEVKLFERHGFTDPKAAHRCLLNLRDSRVLSTVRRQSADRIRQFIPILLQTISHSDQPDQALTQVLPIIEAVLRRTAYLALLIENPHALEHLVKLCSASPWISERIARHPVLLDEFLNIGSLYAPPNQQVLQEELRQQLVHIPEDDLESQMEALRYFKMAHVLRLAAAQVVGTMPLMKQSDYLTWIAEAVLKEVLSIAWHHLVARYGQPMETADKPCDPGFIIVGYGKLGGVELGPGSDIDLVFIHNGGLNLSTNGECELDNNQFFIRLGQRIVHILSTSTASGQLYEVDMRLRPFGSSGLLVSSFPTFEKYQKNEAWTWEHQALVRARVIAGCPKLGAMFEVMRSTILAADRDLNELRQKVLDMRHKMRSNLGVKETGAGTRLNTWNAKHHFHLKQDVGGIVDIEFITQYVVLAWFHEFPSLSTWSDNIRILEEMEQAQILPVQDCKKLRCIYQTYRKTLHLRALQNLGSRVSSDQFHEERKTVIAIWDHLMQTETLQKKVAG
ncbi:MAG: bifunctional [glutamate--ammonia ligase]-adenylyl-L-tyrosine phosphorylase/[glutamate--ammonia-ligase] adenylyltransferase [Endozoicomonadaceae bacterium]|nr:bifunctional [glutamate--ammonia ligase]-adenylyl-L-tyrosine phosphorylase/[glutamate--ammonia-ligase] adenylyltransferase [Endozoicomonadaceae bacterium]